MSALDLAAATDLKGDRNGFDSAFDAASIRRFLLPVGVDIMVGLSIRMLCRGKRVLIFGGSRAGVGFNFLLYPHLRHHWAYGNG